MDIHIHSRAVSVRELSADQIQRLLEGIQVAIAEMKDRRDDYRGLAADALAMEGRARRADASPERLEVLMAMNLEYYEKHMAECHRIEGAMVVVDYLAAALELLTPASTHALEAARQLQEYLADHPEKED